MMGWWWWWWLGLFGDGIPPFCVCVCVCGYSSSLLHHCFWVGVAISGAAHVCLGWLAGGLQILKAEYVLFREWCWIKIGPVFPFSSLFNISIRLSPFQQFLALMKPIHAVLQLLLFTRRTTEHIYTTLYRVKNNNNKKKVVAHHSEKVPLFAN